MRPFRETDLYDPIRNYLTQNGYAVRSEVHGCDITATKDDELVVVELKRGFTIDLLVQAADRQRFADSVYLAIPVPKRLSRRDLTGSEWRGKLHLLRRLGLGLILVAILENSNTPVVVEVALHPVDEPKPRRKTKMRRAVLREAAGRSYDYNKGGSTGTKIVTAYREEAVFIACCLERDGALSPSQLRKRGASERAQRILRNNLYLWFDRRDRGIYSVRESALIHIAREYAHLAALCRQRMGETPNSAYTTPSDDEPLL